jgi:hypothetical protein
MGETYLLSDKPLSVTLLMAVRARGRAGHQWFMHVILATWEAEIGRIIVQGYPRQVCEIPISNE